MTLPSLFPSPTLAPFAFDASAFFASVSARVADMRAQRAQPPLATDGQILIGQENLSQLTAAPGICLVPMGFEYKPSRNTRANVHALSPQILWSSWLLLSIHCWGDDDPKQVDPVYSFSSAIDLSRQALVSLQAANGGVPRVDIRGSEFVQKTDKNRMGRKLVLSVAIEVWVTDDPPIFMPPRTATTPGVHADVAIDVTSPDGSSTIQAVTFEVPS